MRRSRSAYEKAVSTDRTCKDLDADLAALTDEGFYHTLHHIAHEINRRWPGRGLVLVDLGPDVLEDLAATATDASHLN